MTSLLSNEQAKALNGPEKVAAVLLSLDKDVAQRVLKHFDQNELRRLAKHAAGLGSVPASILEQLIDDMIDNLSRDGSELVGSAGQAEQLLTGIIPPEQLADIMSDVLGSSNQFFWRRLSTMPEAALAAKLVNEHPQTIAVIVSKVDSSFAAKLLARLPGELRNSVMRRMLVARPVSDAALRILETTLQEDLLGSTAADATAGSKVRVAGIINQMEREQMEDILGTIAESEPKIAEELKSLLFTFEDIPKLNSRAKTILFDQLPTEQLILALKGADASIKEAALPYLGARVRRMVEAELARGEAPPRRDVLKAQREIAETVLKLGEQGVIEIGAPDEETAAE